MLSSMTGHGEATCQLENLTATAEIRSTNNRYFKFSVRSSDGYASLEPRLERLVRQRVRRGSVHLALKLEHAREADDLQIDVASLLAFREQLTALPEFSNLDIAALLPALLALPGVVEDRRGTVGNLEGEWPTIEKTVTEALDQLLQMRGDEGQAMAADLESNIQQLQDLVELIQQRVPQVTEAYQERLLDRLNKLLAEHEVSVDPSDVVREIGFFVDRSDISEEVVRLKSHVDQFTAEIELAESQGRKLDFLTQEMSREVNTIGSKANDSEISAHAIEIKTTLERMREMVQNVE